MLSGLSGSMRLLHIRPERVQSVQGTGKAFGDRESGVGTEGYR